MNLIKRGTKLVAGVLITTLLSAIVLTACSNSPDDNTAAKYLPDNTMAFVTAALSPSVKQKASLALMSQHVPGDAHAAKANDVKDKLLTDLFKSEDLNYDTDIKPWLGTEAAIAELPPVDGSNTPLTVSMVQTDDDKKAVKLLQDKKVNADTYRVMKSYIFFVDEADLKDHQAAKAFDTIQQVMDGKTKSLQSTEKYKSDLKLLHGEHLVLGWVDLPGLTKLGVAELKKQQQDSQSSSSSTTSSFDSTAFTGKVSNLASINVSKLASGQPGGIVPAAALTDLSGSSSSSSSSSSNDDFDFGDSDSSSSSGNDDAAVATQLGESGALGALGTLSLLGGDSSEATTKAADKLQQQADQVGAVSFELFATSNGIAFEAVTEKVADKAVTGSDHKILNSLPEGTDAAVDIGDFGSLATKLVDGIKSIQKPEDQTADSKLLTDDASALIAQLGDEGVVSVDATDDISNAKYGFVSSLKDQNAAIASVKKAISDVGGGADTSEVIKDFPVLGGTGWQFGDSTFVAMANQRMAISTDKDYVNALLKGDGTFGNTPEATTVLRDVGENKTSFEAFVNIKTLIASDKSLDGDNAATATDEDQKIKDEWMKSLGQIGYQQFSDGEHYHVDAKLTFAG